jgi:hypothetical protein
MVQVQARFSLEFEAKIHTESRSKDLAFLPTVTQKTLAMFSELDLNCL